MTRSNDPEVVTLPKKTNRNPDGVPVHRAGIVLFQPAEKLDDWQVLVIKPIANPAKALKDPPRFQLVKGSRQVAIDGDAKDVDDVPREKLAQAKPADYESFAATAVRELEEEAGIHRSSLKGPLFDAGEYTFASSSAGAPKALHMFASAVKEPGMLGKLDPQITADARWMTLRDFVAEGKPDHAAIVKDMLSRLEVMKKAALNRSDKTSGKGGSFLG